MISYINKFKDKKTKLTTTMSLMVKDKQLFENYNKIWEKTESLIRKKFDSKLFYGNNDNNYIKTKIKTLLQIFMIKNCLKKKYDTTVYQ